MDAAEIAEIKRLLLAEVERLRASGQEGLAHATSRERPGGDEVDFATSELLFSTEMRLRDREKNLLGKIQSQLRRIASGELNECEECGGEIGFPRLRARPVTTMCLGCKEFAEREEKARQQGRSETAFNLGGMGGGGE